MPLHTESTPIEELSQAVSPSVFIAIDFADLDQAIATNAPTAAAFKAAYRHGSGQIKQQFHNHVPVNQLVKARSDLIDALLNRAWEMNFGDLSAAALVAVGGYGRAELHPASDVDIMILLEDESQFESQKDALEQFHTFLWDLGLEIGQSVRTIEDCVREGARDISVATNLMEARLLTGSAILFKAMQDATGPDRIWNNHDFFAAKWREQKARHARFDDSISNLEPNIKEGPGGLRDIQMIGWVAKRYFRAETLHDLVVHNFLTEAEYHTLIVGQNYLWRVRFALHLLTGRHDDRLLFDHQRSLATELGYAGDSGNLAVECFMQEYYRTAMELSRLNEMLLQHFQEAILLRNQLGEPVSINRRFQHRSGFLEVTHDKIFERHPTALLELFYLLQNVPELKGVRASTIRLIRANLQLIDDKFRQDIRAQSLFMEILRHPHGVTHALRRMNLYGVLANYIPTFENIVGRMQYDLFHVYTVDEHTLMVLRNLRRLTTPEYTQQHPLSDLLFKSIPKEELLYLAALFHDIGKGRGGDHSTIGAEIAFDFCRLHHLSHYDSNLVSWLVRNHLVMSMTAQRKDITDPVVVQEFAAKVGDLHRLSYLYLLTVADSQGTNPRSWNSWKASLLRDLFIATRRALIRGLDNPLAQQDLIQEKQMAALKQLQAQGLSELAIHELWQTFSSEYFLTHSPNAIIRHTQSILTTPVEKLPLIALRQTDKRGGTEILYFGTDWDNQFAVTTALLDQLGLSIVNARIMQTTTNHALNSYLVLEQDGTPVEIGERSDEILQTLKTGLAKACEQPFKVTRRLPRQNLHFNVPTQINFYKDPTHNRTALRLQTQDRPGLLSKVGQAFAKNELRLQHAKITTLGAEVEDVFFITDRKNRPLEDPVQLQRLEQNLLELLEQ